MGAGAVASHREGGPLGPRVCTAKQFSGTSAIFYLIIREIAFLKIGITPVSLPSRKKTGAFLRSFDGFSMVVPLPYTFFQSKGTVRRWARCLPPDLLSFIGWFLTLILYHEAVRSHR